MIYEKRNMDNLNKLAYNTKKAALKWYEEVKKAGIEILVYETVRTIEQQRQNVANGKSQTLRSYHLVAQALDFVLVDKKGNAMWNGYQTTNGKKVISIAKKLGFESGGDWKTFKDYPHLQYNYKGYGTDIFKKDEPKQTFTKPKTTTTKPKYPNKIYKVKTPLMKDENVKLIQKQLNKYFQKDVVKVDGYYGQNTAEKIKLFQTRKGLTKDGVVGEKTWNNLFK